MTIPTAKGALAAHVHQISTGRQIMRDSVDSVLRGVRERENDLHAWVQLNGNALTEAEQAPAGPLTGVVVGVKDIIDVAGMPTRCGSDITSPEPVVQDAACVSRLRELGAVIGGKTVTTEFGYFAPGPTRNPAHLEHTPGGSSSGSAAAVAAGTVPLALGTQTAGSLTRPASYCGAAGLALTQGSTSLIGITGLSSTLDTLGLLAGNVGDLKYFYESFSSALPAEAPNSGIAYLWPGSALHPIDPEMGRAVKIACGELQDLGFAIQDLAMDDHVATLAEDQVTVMSFEAYASHGRWLGKHSDSISEPLNSLLHDGSQIKAPDYADALVRRDRTLQQLESLLDGQNVIIGPAAPGAAPRGIESTGSPILSRPWQLLGLPVVTVPGLRTSQGLPLGIQLIAPAGGESRALAIAEALEDRLINHTVRKGKDNA